MLANEPRAVIVRMNTVGRVIEGCGLCFHSLGKELIKRNVCIRILLRKTLDNRKHSVKIGAKMSRILCIEKVGGENNNLRIRFPFNALEDASVIKLKLLVRGSDPSPIMSVPDIVNADKYRDYVGGKLNSVDIKSVKQLTGSVTAYAEVDELKGCIGIRLAYMLCGVFRVAGAEIVIIAPIATCIRDAIPLKKYSHSLDYFTITP